MPKSHKPSPKFNEQDRGRPLLFSMRLIVCLLLLSLSGCAVITVADAAVSVGATAVKAGAAVVGSAVDVTAAVAKTAVGSDSN